MAYAELWMPIQNAVQNLNQTINNVSDREDARAARGLQNLMAVDELAGRQFQREHTAQEAQRMEIERAHGRRVADAASDRAERQLQLSKEGQTFSQALAKAQDAREAARFKAEEPARRLAQMTAENALVPKDVNIYSIVPNNPDSIQWAFSDTDAAKKMAEIIGGTNATFDKETGLLVNSQTGERIQKTNFAMRDIIPTIMGVATSFSDPWENEQRSLQNNMRALDRKKEQLKVLKKAPNGIGSRHAAELEYRINKEEEALKTQKNIKPWDKISQYETRQRVLDQLALYHAQAGGDPNAARIMLNASEQNSAILKELYEQRNKALGDKSGNSNILKMAYRKLEDGTIEKRLIGVPKVSVGMAPGDIDPSLEGWQWGKEGEGSDGSGLTPEWTKWFDRGLFSFGKGDDKGQFVVTPGLQDMRQSYERLFVDYANSGMSPPDAMIKARDTIVNSNNAYWETVKDAMLETNRDPTDPKDYSRMLEEARKYEVKPEDLLRENFERLGPTEQVAVTLHVMQTKFGYIPNFGENTSLMKQ